MDPATISGSDESSRCVLALSTYGGRSPDESLQSLEMLKVKLRICGNHCNHLCSHMLFAQVYASLKER